MAEGGVIAYPTDTIWGLGCDAEDNIAVQKIFGIKQRKAEKSMIILVDGPKLLQRYAEIDDLGPIKAIFEDERPTTIVLPKGRGCARELIAEDGTVAIRMTRDPLCKAIIAQLKRGLVSTSANLSGQQFDGNFKNIAPEIIEGVDFAFEARREEEIYSPPSKLVRLNEDGSIDVLRA